MRPERQNFSAGELSPWRRSASQHASYQNGLATCRNFVVNAETNVTRRPGTKFIRALKTESELGRLLRFRYSGSDSYHLILNGGAIRFLRAGGIVLNAGNPYEVAMPWAAADLENVRIAQEGSTAWIVCRGHEPRTLTRGSSHTDWTLATYRPTGGPVKTQNLDTAKTISPNGRTGSVTLNGVGTNFQAGHVGSVWKLAESDLSLTPNWKASETISLPIENLGAGTNIGDFTNLANAFDGNIGTAATKTGTTGYVGRTYSPASTIYQMRVRGSRSGGSPGTVKLYGKVGAAPANATDGTELGSIPLGDEGAFDFTITASNYFTAYDHIWIAYSVASSITFSITELNPTRFTSGSLPILRRYNGNVYEAIAGTNTGVAPPTHTEGDVLSEQGGTVWHYRHGAYGMVRIDTVSSAILATGTVLKTLPDSVTSRATYRWSEGAWNGIDGWPEQVLLIDRGLFFGRGRDWWMTSVANPSDLEVTDIPEESAIAQTLRSRNGGLPSIEWALDNGVIVLGLRDGEVLLRAAAALEPLTTTNVRAPAVSGKGSAAHIPAALEGGVVWIHRSRQRLYFTAFDQDTQKLEPVNVSKHGRHLLKAKAAALAWQQDPHGVLWIACQDGSLAGLTLNIEDKILAMHSHPMANAIVEDISAMPSSDEAVSDVVMIVRRTINGATHRYVEMLGSYFEAASGQTDAAGAWFFDSALEYSGGATGTITGLSHLEGQEVGILANKCAHARKTVTGAAVTLDRSDVTHAIVGLPIDARIVDLPRNAVADAQTTKGKQKTATHAVLDLVETIGGSMSVNGGRAEQLELTGASVAAAPPLFSGSKRRQMKGRIDSEAAITITAAEGFPMTVAAFTPDLEVIED